MQAATLDDLLNVRCISRTPQAYLQPFGLSQILVLFTYLRHFKFTFFQLMQNYKKFQLLQIFIRKKCHISDIYLLLGATPQFYILGVDKLRVGI